MKKQIKNLLKIWGPPLLGGALAGAFLALIIVNRGLSGVTTQVINKQENLTVEESSAVIEAVEKVMPSVVSVVSSRNVETIFGGIIEQRGGGTGFIITADGLIATNKHVVEDTRAEYTVLLPDGRSFEAKVAALDPLNDFAILKIEVSNLSVVNLGTSKNLKVGQRVVAIGNALGEYQNTVTSGIISAVDRVIIAQSGQGVERLEGVIQTDASINPGNSGGPLVNLGGQVIGVNTAVDMGGQLIGFAIPVDSIKSAIDSFLKKGRIVRPRLGVCYFNITNDFAALNKMKRTQGALIARGERGEAAVTPGGPADRAGLKENDIILAINGEEITPTKSLVTILQRYQPGENIELTVERAGREFKVTVTLDELR